MQKGRAKITHVRNLIKSTSILGNIAMPLPGTQTGSACYPLLTVELHHGKRLEVNAMDHIETLTYKRFLAMFFSGRNHNTFYKSGANGGHSQIVY